MNIRIAYLLLLSLLAACAAKQEVGQYLSPEQAEAVKYQFGAYLDKKPDGAADSLRIDPAYADIYQARAKGIEFLAYHVDAATGLHYFMVLKPEHKSIRNKKRVVGGTYRLVGKEIEGLDIKFMTPAEQQEVVVKLGEELFPKLVAGKISEYVGQNEYIEFPNAAVYYDTLTNNWEFIGK